MNQTIGSVIDNRYKLTALLGSGATSSVFLAKEIDLERLVAVKVYNLAILEIDQEKRWKRIMREAQSLAKIQHPGIVSIYRVGTLDDSNPFIVMEYVEGETLRKYIQEKAPLPCQEAVLISIDIARALSHAHKLGVVHRDLKPENITIQRQGSDIRIKLLDFGFCKDLSVAGSTASTNSAIGTPGYMSPEQCLNEPVDFSTDLYSLGCITYELITGHQPFRAESLPQMLLMHLSKAPTRLLDISPDCGLPPELDEFLAHCLAKNPKQRFPDADQLITELQTVEAEDCHERFPAENTLDTIPIRRNSSRASLPQASWVILGLVLIAVFLVCVSSSFLNRGNSPPKESLNQIGLNIDKKLREGRLSEASELVEKSMVSDNFLSSSRSQRIAWLDKYFNSFRSPEAGAALPLKLANLLFSDLIEEAGEHRKKVEDELWLLRVKATATYLIKHEHSPSRWSRIIWLINEVGDEAFEKPLRFLTLSSKDGMILHELRAVAALHATRTAPDSLQCEKAAGDYLDAAEMARSEDLDFEYQRYMKAGEKLCALQRTFLEERLHTMRAEEYLSKNQLDKAEAELVIARAISKDADLSIPTNDIRKREKVEQDLRSRRMLTIQHPRGQALQKR